MAVLPDRGERQTAGIERNPFGRGLDETVADAVSSPPCSRQEAAYRRHRWVFRGPDNLGNPGMRVRREAWAEAP